MRSLRVLKAIGLLVGMIVGAGMFALPYSVSQAGLLWSAGQFVFVLIIVTIVHMLYARFYLEHKNHARLPGYVAIYFGSFASRIALFSRFFSYFGYLLAYGVLGGFFLEHFFPSFSPFALSSIFFIALAPLLLMSLRNAGTLNLFLTVPLIIFPIVLFTNVWPHLSFRAVEFSAVSGQWFLPYGIFLFAFSGASIIPEIVDTIGKRNKQALGLTIIIASLIVAIIYILFIASVLGITDGAVSEDGLSALKDFDGENIFLIGTLIGLFAIVTSYITLALELRFTFEYDLRWSTLRAWIATAWIPLALYLAGVNNFIRIVSIIGAFGIGIEGIFIMLLARKALRTGRALSWGLVIVFACGAGFGVLDALGIV